MDQRCRICNSNTVKYQETKFGSYHHCAFCDFIFKDEKDLLTKADELEIYNSHNNSMEDPGYVAFLKAFIENAILPFAPPQKNGFDFGSGPEPVLAQLLERDYGYKMDIYDYYYSPWRSYENKKYDLVSSTEVVEHLQDPLTAFRLLKSLLNRDGILAVMTHFHPNDPQSFAGWHYIRDRTHISFYTPKTMEYIAEEVGLRIRYTDDIRYTTFTLK